jgi:hypothetical protein
VRKGRRAASAYIAGWSSEWKGFLDGAPIGFAGNGGELWRIDYLVTNPVTDAAADISHRFDEQKRANAATSASRTTPSRATTHT